MSRQHPRAAPTKTTPPFQTLEAALPPGMVQAADPVARKVLISRNWRHLVQFRGTLDGPHGGIVRFGCNLSRVGRGLYFAYVRGRRAKRAPNIAIPSCAPASPCMSTRECRRYRIDTSPYRPPA